MKKILSIIALLLLVAAVALVLIFNNDKSDYRIVKFSGAVQYYNWSFSSYNNVIKTNAKGISAMPLYADEMILMEFDSPQYFYRYKVEDGVELDFQVEEFKLFLNEELTSIEISNNAEVLKWLESVDLEELSDLASIHITDSLPESFIESLERLAEVKPNLGISFEEVSPKLTYFLSIFDPVWLACPYVAEVDYVALKEILENSENLELLFIDGEFLEDIDLSGLNQLKQLIILEYYNETEKTELNLPKNLEGLYFAAAELDDLSFLEGLPELRSLAISLSDEIKLADEISKHTRLKSLSLSGSLIEGFELIGAMPNLKRFAFPGNIEQNDFDEFLALNNQLEVVELSICESITDISPLMNLPKLTSLTVNDSDIPYEAYYGFKGLKYLSFSAYTDDDKASIDSLQSNLPDTIIVPSSGLCLGSGWLLAILPLLLVVCLFLFIRKNKLVRN